MAPVLFELKLFASALPESHCRFPFKDMSDVFFDVRVRFEEFGWSARRDLQSGCHEF